MTHKVMKNSSRFQQTQWTRTSLNYLASPITNTQTWSCVRIGKNWADLWPRLACVQNYSWDKIEASPWSLQKTTNWGVATDSQKLIMSTKKRRNSNNQSSKWSPWSERNESFFGGFPLLSPEHMWANPTNDHTTIKHGYQGLLYNRLRCMTSPFRARDHHDDCSMLTWR